MILTPLIASTLASSELFNLHPHNPSTFCESGFSPARNSVIFGLTFVGMQQHYTNILPERAIFSGNGRAAFFKHPFREEPAAGRLFDKGREKEEFTSAGRIARYA